MPVRGVSSISAHVRGLERRQRGLDVGHLVGDVVQARAAAGEEPADRRVVGSGAQQLDVVLADVEQHGLDALLGARPRGATSAMP